MVTGWNPAAVAMSLRKLYYNFLQLKATECVEKSKELAARVRDYVSFNQKPDYVNGSELE